jgi:hypothetical protein
VSGLFDGIGTAFIVISLRGKEFVFDRILFPVRYSPTMSCLTTPRRAASSPSCKDNIQWCSFLPTDRKVSIDTIL